MTTPFRTSYQIARERFRALDRRLSRVARKPPVPLRVTVALRPAAEVPYLLVPPSFMRPEPETDLTIRRFVVEEFREAARKRDRAG